MIENDQAIVLRDFWIKTDKMVVDKQLDICKKEVVVTIPSDGNIRKKEN